MNEYSQAIDIDEELNLLQTSFRASQKRNSESEETTNTTKKSKSDNQYGRTQLEIEQALEAIRNDTETLESEFMKIKSNTQVKERKILTEIPNNNLTINKFMKDEQELTLSEVIPNVLNFSTVAIAGTSRKLGKSILVYEVIADVLLKRPTEEIFVICFLQTFDAKKCARIIRKHCRQANVTYRSTDQLARIRIFTLDSNAKFHIIMRSLDALVKSLKISLLVIENLTFYYQNWKNCSILPRWVSRKEYINYYLEKFSRIATKHGVPTVVTLPDHLMEQDLKEKKSRKISNEDQTNTEEMQKKHSEHRQPLLEKEINAELLLLLEKQKSTFVMRVKNTSYDNDESFSYQIREHGFEWKK